MRADDVIRIGEVAERSGLAASALRFYESLGLIRSDRTSGGGRTYPRHVLRRVALIRIAQRLGLTLEEIGEALAILPADRAPTKAEWAKLSRSWRRRLDDRIAALEALRSDLTGCIGCGCLSLQRCRLYNPDDIASTRGPSARYLLGDHPEELVPDLADLGDAPSQGRR
ncbi:MAG: redox-sensitive transcriptional activator SoxR [Actinobacteria bacterium]|nr:redox-sensitive transcriptional activator SoxR [Actinomycetota bacterium]